MYAGPVIDAHHHLWDLSMGQHPWLSPGQNDGVLATLAAVAQNYLIDDYRRDATGQNIVASVHIEALWGGDPLGETRWLDTLDKSSGVALRYVANARLGSDDAARLIAGQTACPRVVGVRGILSHHPDPTKSFVQHPRLAYDPAWRRDIGLVRDHGLHLELMMYPYQAAAVFDLGQAFPDLMIVINHGGSPIDRDPAGMRHWRDALRKVAALPNTVIKISNPGAYDRSWTIETISDVVRHCLDCFGPHRAMFGTDAPVSRIAMRFAEVYDTFRHSVADLSVDEQSQLFFGTACLLYRLDELDLIGPGLDDGCATAG